LLFLGEIKDLDCLHGFSKVLANGHITVDVIKSFLL
jgi:hypothetical protein